MAVILIPTSWADGQVKRMCGNFFIYMQGMDARVGRGCTLHCNMRSMGFSSTVFV